MGGNASVRRAPVAGPVAWRGYTAARDGERPHSGPFAPDLSLERMTRMVGRLA